MSHSRRMNAVYSALAMRRRYEVWFLRCGLADGSGAWWFRYLLMNPGRAPLDETSACATAQVWATWFPRGGEPRSFIQGFRAGQLDLSPRRHIPFHCRIAECGIEEGRCWGNLHVEGHDISWRLELRSDFGVVLSDKGWIGFSRSPHSDATFSGEIVLDGRAVRGEPLGFGVQGHNCGYRHRSYWRWMHAYFPQPGGKSSTLEALVYDLPLGLTFRNAILWHDEKILRLHGITEKPVVREPGRLEWQFTATGPNGRRVAASIEARAPEIHRLPYTKTDGSGTFPVANGSLAAARVTLGNEILETSHGAVLEFGGV